MPGCETLSNQGCQGCLSPFRLSSGRCIIDNCNDHNYITRKCRSCKVGFHLENGICVANRQLCATYTLNGEDEVCSSCTSSDYILTDQFICELKKPGCLYQYGKCISCTFPFRKDSNGVCVIDGCTKYSLTGCTTCVSPFQLNLGSCIIANCAAVIGNSCSKCSAGYRLNSAGLCLQEDDKCTAYLKDVCQACLAGYRVSKQGVCARDIANCKTISNENCEECVIGYQLVMNQCLITDKFCSVFDSRGKGCLTCVRGYHT